MKANRDIGSGSLELNLDFACGDILRSILEETLRDIRSRKGPPAGMSVAAAYDRMRFCETLLETLELYLPRIVEHPSESH